MEQTVDVLWTAVCLAWVVELWCIAALPWPERRRLPVPTAPGPYDPELFTKAADVWLKAIVDVRP